MSALGKNSPNGLLDNASVKSAPASFGQERLWFIDQLDPGNSLYNVPKAVRLRGVLSLEVLRQSLDQIVDRHEPLRTCFEYIADELRQKVWRKISVRIGSSDLSSSSPGEREEAARRLAGEDARRPFDLAQAPLWRVRLVKLAEQDHVLVFIFHHTIIDGWSIQILLQELFAVYDALCGGRTSDLAPLPLHFSDFAQRQRESLKNGSLKSQAAYWQKQLGGELSILDLPSDRPRPPTLSSRGRHARFLLPKELAGELKALSRKEHATLYITLLAGFQALLAHYTSQQDILVGCPIAGRSRADTQRLVGFFINTVVLRVDHSGNPTFRELLKRVRQVTAEAFENQDVPFEHVVELVQPKRERTRNVIFQTVFQLRNDPRAEHKITRLEIEPFGFESGIAALDLAVSVADKPEGLLCEIEYNADLFDESTVLRLAEHYGQLLRAACQQPNEHIANLSFLSQAERTSMLETWNQTTQSVPSAVWPALFEEQAARTPSATALIFKSQKLSYAELNERANQLARLLISKKIGPEDIVALALPRSIEAIVAILGVLKAGAAYAALDPDYPAERLGFMLDDSRAKLILASAETAMLLPTTPVEKILIDDPAVQKILAANSKTNPSDRERAKPLSLLHPAYVIYTSGSTGQPKGVVISHRGIANLASAQNERFAITSSSRVLQFASLSFDASVSELSTTFLAGASLVLISAEERSGETLAEALRRDAITHVSLPPAVLATLPNDARLPLLNIKVAGEACPPELVERWSQGRRFINGYGPTETTVGATMTAPLSGPIAPPIGTPIWNTRVYVLNRYLQPLPAGVPGELYVASIGLARGYLNRPGLTAERFLPDPFGPLGSRMYRTGDLARWRADGVLDFLGRSDFQVKIRGARVELGEIEAALSRHPQIAQAVVIAREDGEKRLIAYVVPAAGQKIEPRSVREQLAKNLPDYMVPSSVTVLDALPLTANGKLDRQALPEPEMPRADFRPARGPQEEILCSLFAETLKIDRVGLDDNFFELGGHSLLATRLISRIRTLLGVELSVRMLFDAPSVAGLAEQLNKAQKARKTLAPRSRPAEIPLSFAQKRLWFLYRLEGPSPTYNVPMALRFNGAVQVDALQAALGDVVARHESLRTIFPEKEGQPHQEILPAAAAAPKLQVVPGGNGELMSAEAKRGFDLRNELPVRAHLFVRSEQEHVLLLVLHHIAGDGWSSVILLRDLAKAYAARCQGAAPNWTPLPVQYADYTLWQHELLGNEAEPASLLAQQLVYWKKTLANLPEQLPLPTDRPRPAVATYRGGKVPLRIDASLHQKLAQLARDANASIFMVAQAAFAALLSRLGGGDDIPIGTPIAGRTDTALDDLIGFFINRLVLRTDTSGNPTFLELLQRVRRADLEAYANQDLPFEQLVEALNPSRSLSVHPLFQVELAFQNVEEAKLELPELSVTSSTIDTQAAKFDLTLGLSERLGPDRAAQGISGAIEYSSDLFDQSTIEALARRFVLLLQAVATDPNQRIGQIDILGAQERELLQKWSGRSEPAPEKTLPQLFEEQVLRTPQTLAVTFGEQSFSYRELNERANRWAHLLQARDIGPEDIVALALPRSIEMIAVLLGIVKAGAAYLPLDSDYPPERLSFMLDEAKPKLLITSSVLSDRLPETPAFLPEDPPRLMVEDDEVQAALAESSATNPPRSALPRHPAYVIYTSGSSGKPKGVVVTHAGLPGLALAQNQRFVVGPSSRVLQFASLSFDVSVSEILLALLSGAALVLITIEERNSEDLVSTLRKYGITHAKVPPVLLNRISKNADLPLQTLIVGGEALPPDVVAHWAKGRRMFNEYGPTETTVTATLTEPLDGQTSPSIGRPICHTRIYLLDTHLQPVPAGVPGEIYIAGAGLARGYLKQAALTAERFLADPLGTPGARMYRTGDLAKWRPDGTLDFLGRSDEQVKIRGFRIELGEIEATLLRHADVAQAVVMAREDQPGEKRLVAYVVPVAGHRIETSSVRSHLMTALPDYMVPTAFVIMEALPPATAGKLDRKALPAPEFVPTAFRAPRSPQEEILCSLFADVLSVPQVGLDDNFFDLGGHSLLATSLISRIRGALGVELPIASLFSSPTVAGVSEILKNQGRSARPPLRAAPRPPEIPLSFAQRRLWFLYRLEGSSPTYNIPLALRFTGPLDRRALEAALEDITERHESLRTIFAETNGVPHQQILDVKTGAPRLTVTSATEETLAERLAAEAAQGFDLNREVALRAHLFVLNDNEQILLLLMHHVVSDDWSMAPLTRDLASAYAARCQGIAPKWTPLPVQYADYTLWQHELLGRENDADSLMARQLACWKKTLANLPEQLPWLTDHPRPAVASYRGERVRLEIGADLHERLSQLARESNATLFMVIQAGFAALLTRLGAGTDIPLGSPIAGRTDSALDDLVGFFVNRLVLRTDTSGNPTFRELLTRVRSTDLEAYANQDLPFEQLVEALNPNRSLALHPLFQVELAFQNAETAKLELPGVDAAPVRVKTNAAKFDLTLNLSERRGPSGAAEGLRGVIHYSADLFEHPTIEKMAERFVRLLQAIAADPDQRVGCVDILGSEEKERILRQWNETTQAAPAALFPALFEERAALYPQATAVIFENENLVYAELNARANQLAHLFLARGIGPEDIVALALPRSIEMIVAVLAVLKTGAAYLPLDPEYPIERLKFMLEDSRPKLLVTKSEITAKLPETPAYLPEDPPRFILDENDVQAELASSSKANPSGAERTTKLQPQHSAYVIYTSGSTGTPKGVVVSHAGISNLAACQSQHFNLKPSSRLLQFASLSFDAAVSEITTCFFSGAALVLAPPVERIDDIFTGALQKYSITHATLPPAMLTALPRDEKLPLETLVVAGDTCLLDLVEHWSQRCRMINAYGPTEATVCASMSAPLSGRIAPIGRPMWNTRIYVLDQNLRPVPPGVAGELYICGLGLARGYLGRSSLTAERFIADPFGPSGGRMYRTGDLATWNDQGVLSFLGRSDFQVKVRGFRIELEEIESALHRYPGVMQAAVLAREDKPGEKRLVAYLVLLPRQNLDTYALRSQLAESLPEYMVPAAFVVLDELPLTPNGKLDRKALPPPDFTPAPMRAPRTPEEKILCALLTEMLRVPQVGLEDNFFHLGGDSIISIQLISRMRQAGFIITAQDIFQNQTVEALAAVARPAGEKAPLVDSGIGVVPLTPIIHWLMGKGPARDRLNQSRLLHVPAQLDEEQVLAGLQAVVDHHDALRLQLVPGERWSVSIGAPGTVKARSHFRRIDVSGLDEASRTQRMRSERLAAQDRLAPEKSVVWQVVWLDAGRSQASRLLLVIHHLAVDGVSWRILMPDLDSAWRAIGQGQPPALPPCGTSFRSWALLLEKEAQENKRMEELALWREMFSRKISICTAPLDARRDKAAAARHLKIALRTETTSALLTSVPAAFNATINDVLLTALAMAITRWARRNGCGPDQQALINLETHGREEVFIGVDLSRTVGWFTNQFPVALSPGRDGWDDPGRALKTIKEQLRKIPDNGLGYGLLRYMNSQTGAELAKLGSPEIGFNYFGRIEASSSSHESFAEAENLRGLDPDMPMGHAIEINALVLDRPKGPELIAYWAWAPGLLADEIARNLAEGWSEALETLAKHVTKSGAGGLTPSDVPLVALDQKEIERLERKYSRKVKA